MAHEVQIRVKTSIYSGAATKLKKKKTTYLLDRRKKETGTQTDRS